MSTKKSRFSFTVPFLGLIFSVYIITTEGLFDRIERPDYEIYFTPTWIPLDDPHHSHLFNETTWVQVGTLTIRMKEPSYLHSLTLKWIGHEPIEIHSASLYRGYGTTCKATEEYLIADGQWHKEGTNQFLLFTFPTAEKLHVSNTLYLVLTITRDSEKIVSTGTFQILPDNLPRNLQKSLKQAPVYVTLAPSLSKAHSHIS